jgi:GNAT superfamily N-acetyltransferase
MTLPNTGTVETAAAGYWRLAGRLAPNARIAVIRRPVNDVIDSLRAIGWSADGVAFRRILEAYDRKLDQIEARVPGVLSVSFDDLATEEGCSRLFEHCLPYRFDPEWWASLARANLQTDLTALRRRFVVYWSRLEKLGRHAKQLELAEFQKRTRGGMEGVTFQSEPFATFSQDALDLFRSHMVATDQDVEDFRMKNVPLLNLMDQLGTLHIATARCNGRMVGYLMSVVGASFDEQGVRAAEHIPIFASPDFPGIGAKLMRWADAELERRGVSVFLGRAGHRGSGPRLGVLWKRMGYEPFGEMYRRDVRSAA